jgi:general secretion pathway protein D
MTMKLRTRLTLLMLTFALAACANPAMREAQEMAQAGQHEAALAHLQTAVKQSNEDRNLRAAMIKQQDTTIAHLVYQAESARAAGRLDEVEAVLKRMEAIAPGHSRTLWLRSEVDRLKRHQRLVTQAQQAFDAKAYERAEVALRTVLTEDVGNYSARALLSRIEELRETQTRRTATLQLATAQKPVTLEFREAALRTVFEALARAANINFVFDKDVRGDAKVTLFLRNTTVDEAMRVILSTQQLGSKLLNDNTVMVFPNSSQKQRDLLDTVTRSFYLVNADPKQAQVLVRTVAKSRDVYVDDRLNLLVVRDTPEVMRLVERLIQSIDLPDPEVMLDVEVMEVSSNKLNSIGLSWPDTASYGLPGTATTLQTLKGLRWSTTNPLAVATLRGSTDSTNLLANPKIRAKNREKAKIMLGEKLPVFTSNLVPGLAGAASTTVSYLDVGLKLDIEPQVQLDNDVTIKIALEVSTVTGKVTAPDGSLAYQVGTRQANTTLRLKDGETQILAGLINDNESRNSSGIPGLHDLPVAGRLFGTTTDSHAKTEIVLLVTPRIVRNVTQPSVAASAMPSGTEAQPGAQALLLSKGDANLLLADGGGASSGGPREPSSGRGGQPDDANAIRVTGPEEVLPGAAFQVSIHNPKNTPLNTMLMLDSSVLEFTQAPPGDGRMSLEVPPNSVKVINIRAKQGIALADTTVALDGGGEPLRLRVRNPDAPAPEGAAEEANHGSNDQ